MTQAPRKPDREDWDPGPVVDWLLTDGRLSSDMDALIGRLGQELLAAGAPIWRLRLSMRTLHPLTAAISSVWERESESIIALESSHGLETRSGYVGSPLEIIARTHMPFRKRLADDLSSDDHSVLHDLKARGGTDYFGLPMAFSDGAHAVLVVTTDVAGGFADRDIESITMIAKVLAPITEVISAKGVSLAVAEAYLGPRTGRRVLDGQITRGDVERLEAAVLVSDIRDWTGINNRMPAKSALALANRYFEIISEAVEAHDGEILKLIGDGVLAIFPTDDQSRDAGTACQSALSAARQALQVARAGTPPLELSFGMGMHFGEVLYGNIGSKTRLDFTVLGQAVNLAARIEGLCSKHDLPILFSQDVADRLPGRNHVCRRGEVEGPRQGRRHSHKPLTPALQARAKTVARRPGHQELRLGRRRSGR